MRDVLAEVEGRAAGKTHRVAAIRQQVVEQVIVHQVGLCPPREVLAEENVEAAAETDEPDIVGLARRRYQPTDKGLEDRIGRLRGRGFMDNSRINPTQKKRRPGEVPVDQLRTYGVSLRLGMRRDA